MSDGIRYIKIAKKDKNGIDQTTTLQSLDKLTVPFSTENIQYNIISITEKPTYFLYSVEVAPIEWADRAEIEYNFSSSYAGIQSLPFLGTPQLTVISDNQNFFLEGGVENLGLGSNAIPLDSYRISTYPQQDLNIRVSSSVGFSVIGKSTGTNNVTASLRICSAPLNIGQTPGFGNISPDPTILATTLLTQSVQDIGNFSDRLIFSGSYELTAIVSASNFTPGNCIYFQIFPQVDNGEPFLGCSFSAPINFDYGLFEISSSVATGPEVGIVAEPYFGSNDFKRALDCQPLLNNAERVRKHNLYMDIDYSAAATEPVNYGLLISGSAVRADVQFSNYTTRRHVIPRYEGSRSTSQKLNVFTKGDKGTFGRTPTVESLKRMVVYSDDTSGGIGGWPPEKMNASTIFIRYLIEESGDIKIPNTSENSLQDVQGTFQAGERLLINSKTPGSGEATAYRNIIRGGARIEPVLYRQNRSAPNATFNTTMSFEDMIPSVGGATADYLATAAPPLQGTGGNSNIFQRLEYNYITLGTAITSNQYNVSSDLVGDGVSLTIQYQRSFESHDTNGNGAFGVSFRVVQERASGQKIYFPNEGGDVIDLLGLQNNVGSNIKTISIPSINLQTNDKIYVEFNELRNGGGKTLSFPNGGGWFKITQDPMPTSDVTASNDIANSLWNWGNSSTYPNVITSSNATFVQLYDTTAKQIDISGSGFNTIALPFSIKVGDEFRFEGREDYAFMVKNIYAPYELGNRVFPTGSIEVHFDRNLPTAVTGSTFNLDNFLIRRYVDDPSQIIIEGFKPIGSNGPYIITPEFSTPKLNKGIDEYITILTEKNLLS
tara:strand:+ start:7447 stop:9936 length:2490 start_codon:yes stop_codon:yes gene_type:complete